MMTLNEAIAKTAASIDAQIEAELERNEIRIADHGSTPKEVT